jgi:hypothetical protein
MTVSPCGVSATIPSERTTEESATFSAEFLEKARTAGLEATRPQPTSRRSKVGLARVGVIDDATFDEEMSSRPRSIGACVS